MLKSPFYKETLLYIPSTTAVMSICLTYLKGSKTLLRHWDLHNITFIEQRVVCKADNHFKCSVMTRFFASYTVVANVSAGNGASLD